jgi:hypothetical protein
MKQRIIEKTFYYGEINEELGSDHLSKDFIRFLKYHIYTRRNTQNETVSKLSLNNLNNTFEKSFSKDKVFQSKEEKIENFLNNLFIQFSVLPLHNLSLDDFYTSFGCFFQLLSGIFLLYLFRFEPPFDTWGLMLRRFFS